MKLQYYIIEISNGVYFSGALDGSGYSTFKVTTNINKALTFYSLEFAQEIMQKYTGKIKNLKITYEVGDIK